MRAHLLVVSSSQMSPGSNPTHGSALRVCDFRWPGDFLPRAVSIRTSDTGTGQSCGASQSFRCALGVGNAEEAAQRLLDRLGEPAHQCVRARY
jgi:hypothetical protein